MKYNYNQYKDTKVSLSPKKSIWRELGRFRWEVIIPLFILILCILSIICMQVPSGLA